MARMIMLVGNFSLSYLLHTNIIKHGTNHSHRSECDDRSKSSQYGCFSLEFGILRICHRDCYKYCCREQFHSNYAVDFESKITPCLLIKLWFNLCSRVSVKLIQLLIGCRLLIILELNMLFIHLGHRKRLYF